MSNLQYDCICIIIDQLNEIASIENTILGFRLLQNICYIVMSILFIVGWLFRFIKYDYVYEYTT